MLPLSTSLSALLLGALAPAALADVIVLVSDRDGTLFETPAGDLASGSGQFVFAGKNSMGSRRRALLHFPIEQVPAGSTVNSVTLSLYLASTNAGNEIFRLHRVTHEWGEGDSDSGNGGAGAPAEDMDATWLHALRPGCPWSSRGGDYDPTSVGGAVLGSTAGFFTFSGPGLAANVQSWIDGTAPNFGWLLKHGDEIQSPTAKRLASRENSTAAFRPAITIDFTPGPGSRGIQYCGPGVPSSTGCPAAIGFTGSTRTADNDFTLTVDGVPAGEFGFFIAGQTQGAVMPGASQGIVCLTGTIARFNSGLQLIQGPSGSVRINLNAIPLCLPPSCASVPVAPGDTWSFQCWYRDGAQNNFTDGLQVTFD